jgi:hypothetical protein
MTKNFRGRKAADFPFGGAQFLFSERNLETLVLRVVERMKKS